MELYRIELTAWTSGFRYPNLISGYQPTLEVPPISTVLGLINAAAGKYIRHNRLQIGYYFEFEAKHTDIETIYQVEANKNNQPTNYAKSNVISREFLFNTRLILYTPDEWIAAYFNQPVYPLLMGRSNDLATVKEVKKVNLEEISQASKIKGQVVPFTGNCLPGVVQPLPAYFSDTIPRQNLGTEIYSVISWDTGNFDTRLKAVVDTIGNEEEIHIYMHELNFNLPDA